MFSRENKDLTTITIWQSLDFRTVRQRLNGITRKLEEVQGKSMAEVEVGDYIDPEDYFKLRKFMQDNQLSESKAIAVILNAFFRSTAKASINLPKSSDETL
jgi:hypothetical protein